MGSLYIIVNVTTTTQLDNSTLNLDLEKIDEYEENNETIEIWSANWTVNDVHAITYRTTIVFMLVILVMKEFRYSGKNSNF